MHLQIGTQSWTSLNMPHSELPTVADESRDGSIATERAASEVASLLANAQSSPSSAAPNTSDASHAQPVASHQGILEDFLQLVEPVEHDTDTDTSVITDKTALTALADDTEKAESRRSYEALKDASTRASSATPVSQSPAGDADPRLSVLNQDQLKPIATLFTQFYEEQAASANDLLPKYQRAVELMDLPSESRAALINVLAVDKTRNANVLLGYQKEYTDASTKDPLLSKDVGSCGKRAAQL
ncbi:hypothetical protein THASP1DRAFT_33393, partial [Thamnocephalis sphaerospora]